MRTPGPLAALLALTAASACSKQPTPPPTLPPLNLATGCQPLLDGANCTMPYPSDFFRVADATMPSGYRIDVVGAAQVQGNKGINADVDLAFPIDGASHIPTIVTYFPVAISPAGFVPLAAEPTLSTLTSSNTLLIEADTGTLIPHFVDLDPRTTDLTRQAIVIHPIVGLKPLTRYVVAIHGVTDVNGQPVTTPEGFRRLRDNQAAGDPQLAPLAARYPNDIFAVTTKAGLQQSSLQMAWDFTVGSTERPQADMLQVRQLTLAWLQNNTPTVTVTNVIPNPDSASWYQVTGTVTGPLFLNSGAPPPVPNTELLPSLVRGDGGVVIQNPTTPTEAFEFVVEVPLAIRDQFEPGIPLAYGHGFFGSPDEVTYGSTEEIGNTVGAVLFGIQWQGMSLDDAAFVLDDLSSTPRLALTFADRVHQAMANWIVMTKAMQGPMRELPAFLRPDAGLGTSIDDAGNSNAGQPIYAAGAPAYLGISQGAILGGTMTTLDPDLSTIILNVGGAGFTHMMFRAQPFANFLSFLDQSFSDSLEEQVYCATLQPQFDRFDPGTYAEYMLQNPLPGSPSRVVLEQNGLGDAEVPNLGTFLENRLLGDPAMLPSTAYVPFDVPTTQAPSDSSAIIFWDFGVDAGAHYAVAEPPTGTTNNVHNLLRNEPDAMNQMGVFLRTGVIIDPCDGGPCTVPCDGGVCSL